MLTELPPREDCLVKMLSKIIEFFHPKPVIKNVVEAEIGPNDPRWGTFTLNVCESCSKEFQRARELAVPILENRCTRFHCKGIHTHSVFLSLEEIERSKVIYHHVSEEFDTSIRWKNLDEIDFDEAIARVDWCVDDPVMYSNEPVKDRQAWNHIAYLASLGNHVDIKRKEGKLIEWAQEVENENKSN